MEPQNFLNVKSQFVILHKNKMNRGTMNEIIKIKNLIYIVRGQKVMLDSDLAMLYEVETRTLNQAVKRNLSRFPSHYMFQLTKEEYLNLKSQFVISSWGGVRKLPYVFTEQGVAMLSSVLRSEKAIQVNIQIIDTFVKMRQWAFENKDLAQKLSELERYFVAHCEENKRDNEETWKQLGNIYEVLGLLMDRTKPSKIGFTTE